MSNLILFSIAGLSVLAFVLSLFAIFQARQNKNKINELEGSSKFFSNKLDVLEDSSIGVGKRLHDVELSLQEVQLEQTPSQDAPTEDSVLRAAALLDKGRPVAEIASECDLPEHEIKLMQAVRRSRSVTLTPEVSD